MAGPGLNTWQRYKTLTLACLLVLASLVVLAVSVDRPRDLSVPEKVAIEILAPFQRGIMGMVHWVSDLGRRYITLIETAEENVQLREELTQLRNRMVLYEEAHLANQRLRRILEFKERSPLPQTAAEVVGFDPSGWFRTILVDQGSTNGVTPGMAVVTAEGIVGRTIEVGYNHSKVLLMTDRASAIDALIQRTRARGIVKGSPDGKCSLEFVIRNAGVQEGDTVITSGLANTYPKGLILGWVSSVEPATEGRGMFQKIQITPAVDFDLLEEVLLILKPNPYLTEAGRAPGG